MTARLPDFSIAAPDAAILPALQRKIDHKTKPLGALGQLEQVALRLGRMQQTLTPTLTQPHILVFAGDHGAAKVGVSAFPQDVTWQMVENFLAGGAAINVFARHNGLSIQVIDCGVAHDFGVRDGLVDAKQGPGTANYVVEPAMSAEACAAALARGRALAHELADADPMNVLAEFGGFEIVMMAGAMLGAAERGMTLLIDGFIVTSALLVASRIAPAIRDYCVFCHRSAEPGHLAQLAELHADPLIDLGLRLGEGTGAALAWPLVSAAVAFLNEMASFASAGVSEKG